MNFTLQNGLKQARRLGRYATDPHRLRAFVYYRLHPNQPLFTPSAARAIKQYLKANMSVFEWGAGRSTLFFARHKVNLVSIEHSPVWQNKIQNALRKQGSTNVKLITVPPDKSFHDYIHAIDAYPDNYFDLVCVDGRERLACLYNATAKVKPNGLLLLDDTHRERYQPALRKLKTKKWTVSHYLFGWNRTTIWTKPNT